MNHILTRLNEWALAAGLLVLSFWVDLPPIVGALAILISCAWLTALWMNGTYAISRRWSPWVRSICAGAAGFVWAYRIAGMNELSIDHLILAGVAFTSCIVIAKDVGYAERTAKRCSPPRRTSSTIPS